MVRLADRLVPCDDSATRIRRTLFVFFGAVVTLAAPVAAAMFSLVLATKAGEEEVLLAGYPEISHISAPLGVKEGAEVRAQRLGLDTVTTITVTAAPWPFGLALVCAGSALCVLGGALFSTYSQYKEDNPAPGDLESSPSGAPPPPPRGRVQQMVRQMQVQEGVGLGPARGAPFAPQSPVKHLIPAAEEEK
jgi:hypothetical protein